MPKGRVSNEHKDKSKCSLRKKLALPYILNNGFVIFFKSEFLKATTKKAAKISSPTAYLLLPHVSTNKNITFIQFKTHYVILPLRQMSKEK